MRKFYFTLLTIITCVASTYMINNLLITYFNIDVFFFKKYLNINEIHILLILSTWGLIGGLINSLTSKWQIKKMYKLVKINKENTVLNQRLIKLNNKIAKKLNLKPAKLFMYISDEKNAFVTGAFKNQAMLVVSSNLLNSLSENELESVLWHEYAHIINGDMTTQQILEGIINSYLLFLSKTIQLYLIKNKLSINNPISITSILVIGSITEWFLLFFAKLFFLWFSRNREFHADKFAVKNSGSGIGLLSALQNISYQPETSETNIALNKKIFNIYSYKNEILSTHPSLKNRVVNIEKSI